MVSRQTDSDDTVALVPLLLLLGTAWADDPRAAEREGRLEQAWAACDGVDAAPCPSLFQDPPTVEHALNEIVRRDLSDWRDAAARSWC